MLKLADLNELGVEEFVRVIGPVFEHSPVFAERAWKRRPFASRDELHAALVDAVKEASENEKLALIRAHPDLVGKATLTDESKSEQASAGLGGLTPEEISLFREYNERYRA